MQLWSILINSPEAEGGAIELFQLAAGWQRIQLKKIILSKESADDSARGSDVIEFSECEDCKDLLMRMTRIEDKLDELNRVQTQYDQPPEWYRNSEARLHESIASVASAYERIKNEKNAACSEAEMLRKNASSMAEGVDTFIAGLKAEMNNDEWSLFLELIAKKQDGIMQRYQSYSEIGLKFGITKQAIEKRFKKLRTKHPSVAEYIKTVRNPDKPKNFSEMSPSDRRANGIEESYGHSMK